MLHCKTCNKIFFNYTKLAVGKKVSFHDDIFIDEDKLLEDPLAYYDAEDNDLYHCEDWDITTYLCPGQQDVNINEDNLTELSIHDTIGYMDLLKPASYAFKVTNKNISDLLYLRSLAQNDVINLSLLSTDILLKVYEILLSFDNYRYY